MDLEIEGIIVLTREDACRSDDITVLVHDRQDVTRLTFLAPLIGNGLAAFLGEAMGAVQVEFRQIQSVADGEKAVLPDLFETAIATPAREMQVDRTVTDFFFSAPGRVAIGNSAHWHPVCNQYRM